MGAQGKDGCRQTGQEGEKMKVGNAVGGKSGRRWNEPLATLLPYRYFELIFYLEPQDKVST